MSTQKTDLNAMFKNTTNHNLTTYDSRPTSPSSLFLRHVIRPIGFGLSFEKVGQGEFAEKVYWQDGV